MELLIIDLPLEIQEWILFFLDDVSLIKATNVCCLWWEIGQKCLKQKCLREIPEDIIEELQEDVENFDEVNWSSIYWQWLEAEIHPKSENLRVLSVALNDQPSCIAIHGDTLYVGCDGVVQVYNSSLQSQYWARGDTLQSSLISSASIEDGQVYHLGLMENKQLLLVTGESVLHFFKVSPPTELPWQQLSVDRPVPLVSKNISIFRNCFTVSPKGLLLSVYAVNGLKSETVVVEHVADIETPSRVFLWKMWKERVTSLLTTGEVCVWDLSRGNWQYISVSYSEIRYQNPCWMFRDVILCSTLTSRSLLAYWHMDRGVYYWLVGWGHSAIPFRRWYPGQAVGEGEDVLCVALRRQLLVCGTQSGKLLVYRIKDLAVLNERCSCFDIESELELPSVIIQASEHPVKFVDLGFCNKKIYFFIRTKKKVIECIQSVSLLGLENSSCIFKETVPETPS